MMACSEAVARPDGNESWRTRTQSGRARRPARAFAAQLVACGPAEHLAI